MSGFYPKDIEPPIWARGLHREIKNEFIETYKNNIPHDKLLFLAHAYANVELHHCSYPEPVMLEIRLLAKPLLGVKKLFPKYARQKSGLQNGKSSFDGSSQQVDGCSNSSCKMAAGITEYEICSDAAEPETTISVQTELLGDNLSSSRKGNHKTREVKADDSRGNKSENCSSGVTPYMQLDAHTFATQYLNDHSATAKLQGSSDHGSTDEKMSRASEETFSKITASSYSDSSALVASATNPKKKPVFIDTRKLYGSPLIRAFKVEFLRQLEVLDLIPAASKTADLLRIAIKFTIEERPCFTQTTKFDCDFYLKDLIMSSADGSSKRAAKFNSVKAVYKMLTSASDFVIKIVGAKKYVEAVPKSKANSIIPSIPDPLEESDSDSFALNYDLLYNSLLLRFVLINNNENRLVSQRSALLMLNDSAKLCQTSILHDSVTTPHLCTSVSIKLRGELIGYASRKLEMEARKAASEMAVKKLSKELYTIKIRKEDACGILITPKIILEDRVSDIIKSRNIEPDMFKACGIDYTASCFESIPSGYASFSAEQSLEAVKKNKKLFQTLLKKVDEVLRQYSNSKSFEDVVFSPEFSGRDRTEFSRLATSHDLQTLFRKVDNQYYLRVRRKFTMIQLLNHLVQTGGEAYLYVLVDGAKEPVEF